ncbi:MAG: hypothetical protein E6J32_02875 [Chloroflexi bacterium]|nr:MAG: hypothetical protein E6J32_02875 [Chloroflexota bacterium]
MTNFYLASSAAAATLVGLLFVAVQIGPPLIGAGPIGRRHAMARSTFTIFAILFALSLYLLLPNQPSNVRALVVIAAAAAGAFRAIRTWIPVWADKLQGRVEFRLWQTAWLLVGPLVAYALLALAGLQQLRSADPAVLDQGGVGWFIMLFLIGVRNSWNLLVEANAPPP